MAELLFDKYTVKRMAEITGKTEETIRDRILAGKYRAEKERGGQGWIILIPKGEDPLLSGTEVIQRVFQA